MPFTITDFTSYPLDNNRFIEPVRLNYRQDGQQRSWEAIISHDSVAILLYHTEKKAFLTVKQFRPAVYLQHPQHRITYELCAGIVDKQLTLEEIAREEIDEECGYTVAPEQLVKISSFFNNVGVTGCQQHLFYALIDEGMRVHAGGGVREEQILLEFIPLAQAREFLYAEHLAKTPGLMFAFCWFFERFGTQAERL